MGRVIKHMIHPHLIEHVLADNMSHAGTETPPKRLAINLSSSPASENSPLFHFLSLASLRVPSVSLRSLHHRLQERRSPPLLPRRFSPSLGARGFVS